jgi:hypothetical protein
VVETVGIYIHDSLIRTHKIVAYGIFRVHRCHLYNYQSNEIGRMLDRESCEFNTPKRHLTPAFLVSLRYGWLRDL